MKKRYLVLSLMVWLSPLCAQEQVIGLVFKITTEEARLLYKESPTSIPESYFHTLVDSFARSSIERPNLTQNGHYIFVTPDDERLKTRLESIHEHNLISFNNERDLMLRVLDKKGKKIQNAQLKLGRKKVRYDESIESFRLKRRSRGGFLEVQLEGDTLFYTIDRNEDRPLIARRYKRFTQTRFGFIVTSPIRWTKQTYGYIRQIIRWGDWRPPWRFRGKDQYLNGYVVTQKPKYQVGDTLQVKAFVTTPKGRPIRKGVRLTVRNYQDPGPVLDTLIQPISPGAIVLDWPISDSLQLDRTYNLSLKYPKRQNLAQLTHRFTYEAYQLDEVVYDLHIPQDTFRQGEDFTLTASAKDRNELAVFDAQVKLHLMVDDLLSFHEQEMLIPDTLWSYETAMDQQGSANIDLPDSLFPPARMKIKVVATFSNSNGELQEEVRSFHFSPLQDAIKLEATNGVIKGTYYRNGQSLSTTVLLITQQGYDRRAEADTIQVELPFEIPLSPDIYSYQLIGEKARGRLVLQDNYSRKTSQINLEAIRQGDSLRLSLSNPHRLPITWLIRHANGTLTEGFTQEAVLQWKQAGAGAKTYYLNYQYLWGGQAYQEEKEIIHYKKLLQISIDQPQQVMPGQEVAVKVKVKDHKDRPVKNVNLAVGAINAQFGSNDHMQTASIPYRKGLAPFYYNEFEADASDYQGTNTLNRKWFNQLHLNNSLYYRLRFPEKGVYFQSDTITKDTFYQDIAQFAPYLVKNGKMVPIHLIYCNRKLVYYYDVNHPQPYSFMGNDGLNRITIRTTDEEITIDRVLLKKGHKLEFSIDLLHYSRWEKRHLITRQKMPMQFTDAEKELIRSSILILRKSPRNRTTFIWDDAHSMHLLPAIYSNKEIKVGPFTDRSRLWYKEKNGMETDFIFEAGFSYELARQRERLYAFELPIDKHKELPKILASPSPGQWVYAPGIRERQETKFTFKEYFGRRKQQELKGQYVFSYRHQRRNALQAVLFQQNDTLQAIYRPQKRKIPAIPIGTYQLTLVRADGYLHQREITISANTTLYQQLQEVDFLPDGQGILSTIQLSFSRPIINPQLPRQAGPNPYQSGMQRISGYVTDETGEPLIGASILIKGTTQGTITDIDGYYELVTADPNPVLLINYTGFATAQIKARQGTNDINLEESYELLEEVVVAGYRISNRRPKTIIQQDAVTIRGQGNTNPPLYIIDGKVGDPSQLNPSQIRSIKTLSGEEATAMYGASAAHGVIIITTTGGPALDFFQPHLAKGLRSSFRDFAYWNPNVMTDKKGEAAFKVTFPDNITAWDAYAVGMSTRNRSGVGFAQTQAFKPVIAQLAVPRFLIEGDTAALIGKSSNYTSDSIQIETRFLSADTILSRQETWLQNGNVESTRVHAGMTGDSLAITYSLKALSANYEDGEKRDIPVLPSGTEEHKGHFLLLDRDTSLQLSFPAEQGDVEVYVEKEILSVLIQEIDYLKYYKHGCNEQTASKLMALLLEKEIRAQLGEAFEEEKLIGKCISLLEKNQNPSGNWGWWNRSVGSDWVSRHVIKALLMAQQNGYDTQSLEKALRALTNDINTIATPSLLPNLRLLAEAQQSFPFEDYLAQIDTPLSIHDRLQTIRIRQLADLPYSLDSLNHYRQQTIFGSHYWGEDSFVLTRNEMTTSLLAYQILQAANQPQQAQKVLQFFLEKRRNTGRRHAWRNTMETALILHTILPQVLSEKGTIKNQAQLQLSGSYEASMDTFPQRFSLPSTETEDKLQVQKTGVGTLYFTAFQSFWNSSPAKEEKAFQVNSRLQQDGQLVTQLKQGEKATLIVTVESKASAEYLMLQIPIPGACAYYSKPNGRRGIEAHREYEIHQTNIFIERLPAGKHEFKIALEPRFSGNYQLNPAKVELMYFPTFYGREGMKEVGVVK